MLQQIVKAGSVDVSVVIRILDATDGSPETGVVAATGGLALEYRRELAASTAITESDLAALTTAHTDGGMKHIGNGYYRLDVPDAAFAAGVSGVLIHGTVTGMQVIGVYVQLAAVPADVTAISGDTQAADNLETALDDTAGSVPWTGVLDQGTAQAATGTTLQLRAAAAFADDELNGAVIVITGGSAGVGQVRSITDYVSATDTATVDAWTVTPTGTITYKIFASPPASTSVPMPANVTQWLGTAAATPTVAGVPEVDLTHALGTGVTATAGVPEVKVASIAANVTTEIQAGLATAAALTTVDTVVDAIQAKTDNLPAMIRKNVAIAKFVFAMKLTDGSPGTGLTVTPQISKDGGVFTTLAGAVTELTAGYYWVAFAQAETNADVIAFKATATGAQQVDLTIFPQP